MRSPVCISLESRLGFEVIKRSIPSTATAVEIFQFEFWLIACRATSRLGATVMRPRSGEPFSVASFRVKKTANLSGLQNSSGSSETLYPKSSKVRLRSTGFWVELMVAKSCAWNGLGKSKKTEQIRSISSRALSPALAKAKRRCCPSMIAASGLPVGIFR